MPRLAIVPQQMVKNSNQNGVGSTVSLATLVAAPGGTIAVARPEQLVLRIANTFGTPSAVTILAGANPPAIRAGQGNLAVTVAATTGVQYIGPFESDKYLQADGSISIDFAAGMTGTLEALYWPHDSS